MASLLPPDMQDYGGPGEIVVIEPPEETVREVNDRANTCRMTWCSFHRHRTESTHITTHRCVWYGTPHRRGHECICRSRGRAHGWCHWWAVIRRRERGLDDRRLADEREEHT